MCIRDRRDWRGLLRLVENDPGMPGKSETVELLQGIVSVSYTHLGETPGYGKTVVVTHRFGFQTRYAHLTLSLIHI